MLLLCSAYAHARAIVTDTVVSQTSQAQSNVRVTFGQVFKAGDVPRGAALTASLNGQPVTLQVDTKAINPDGSLRHAVLTAMVSWLPGGAKLPLTIATGSSLPPRDPITLSELLATNYDATASFNIGGTTYTINARGLLQAADNAYACTPWGTQCSVWLSGPLVSAWVVNGPATAADGTINPNLRVYFAVRAYAGATPGTVGYVRTDIIIENSNAYAAPGQPQYSAALTSGTASYASPVLTQYSYTRWHKVLWWNNDQPKVYLQQDTKYIQNSMAVSRYMDLKPSESFLAGVRQSCDPLNHCDQTQKMDNTGAQAAIGPLPRWTSVYIVDPDIRAYRWMLANTDALGAYSIHYRDHATGWPISIQRHPYTTIVDLAYAKSVAKQGTVKGAAYRADLLPGCCKVPNPNEWHNAHQPAEGYVAYMVTGDWYYMSELAFGASHNEIWSNEAYRSFSKGLIDAAHSQPRGKAWVLREMADAAWLLPDSYPLKAEFNADVNNSLADWNRKYTNNPYANPLHVMSDAADYSLGGGTHNGIAPWQHNFLTWSVGHAAELGFPGAADFRNWLAKFEIGLMTDWQTDPAGYCWLGASAYEIQVKDASGHWLPSYSAVYESTFPYLVGLTCNSAEMVAKIGQVERQPWQIGEMYGYAHSVTGYAANFQIGLATAADTGLPGASTAWSIFDSRSMKPSSTTGYNNYPNFALLPRPDSDPTPVSYSEPPPSGPHPPSITRNITLPAEAAESAAETTAQLLQSPQPAPQSPQSTAQSGHASGPLAPGFAAAKPGSAVRPGAGGVLMRIVNMLRSELPSFAPAWLRQRASGDRRETSSASVPRSPQPAPTGGTPVQQTTAPAVPLQSPVQIVTPSMVHEAEARPLSPPVSRSASVLPPGFGCQVASGAAPTTCARR